MIDKRIYMSPYPSCGEPVFCAHCEHEIVRCPKCGKQEWRVGDKRQPELPKSPYTQACAICGEFKPGGIVQPANKYVCNDCLIGRIIP